MGLGKIYEWHSVLLTVYILWNLPTATVSSVCLLGDTSTLEEIDDTKFICCNGKVSKWDENWRKRDCCHVKETNKSGQETFKKTLYDPNVQLCCGQKLLDIQKYKQPPECCGNNVLLNKTSSFCCDGIIYERSKENHYCHKSNGEAFPVGRFEIVCVKASKNEQNLKIHMQKKGWDCCGTELFSNDNKTHFCYGDEIWPKGTVVSECGGIPYNKAKLVCCRNGTNETLIAITKKDDTKYLDISPDYDCLDGKLIDKDIEMIGVYENTKFSYPKPFKPCGKSYYNPDNTRTQTACCNGVVNSAKPGLNVTCCGKEFIDKTKHICCNDTKIPITSTYKCCGNRIYDRTSGLECCGSQLIGRSHLCCRKQSSVASPVKKTEPGDSQCCGNKTYNILEMDCCAGNLMKLAPNQKCDRHTGQVINIADMNSNVLENVVKDNPNVYLPGKDEGNMRHMAPDCPACNQSELLENCVKKFRYHVYIISIGKRGRNTVMDVLVFDPPVRMTFRTSGKCNCFKKNKLYFFYSNRNIAKKVEKNVAIKARWPRKLQMSFSERDVFSALNGQYPSYAETKKCRIDRYLKKTAALH